MCYLINFTQQQQQQHQTKMNQEIKQKWITALTGGKYKQAKNFLQTEDGFCCLGVLCDLYSEETKIPWACNPDGARTYLYAHDVLPPEVKGWAGLDSINPRINDTNTTNDSNIATTLAALNDDWELSFSQIADLIQKNL